MCKAIVPIILALLVLLAGCSGNLASSEDLTNYTVASVNDSKKSSDATGNKILFDMELDKGKMSVVADYVKSDINGFTFLLNRDFEVSQILCDGKDANVDEIVETVYLVDGYEVKQYNLPQFEDTLHVEYTGALSGKTGQAPYVRETISPEFTFLRGETFCHPFFSRAANIYDTVWNPFSLQITVKVPNGYIAEFTYDNLQQTRTSDSIYFTASGELPFYGIAVAIAKYQKVETQTGDYYFLENTNVDRALTMIDSTMVHANTFMNEHFGKVEIKKNLE